MGGSWNLNEAASVEEEQEEEGSSRTGGGEDEEEKGEAANDGSVSSDAVVEVSEEGEPVPGAMKIFGFSISGRCEGNLTAESEPNVVTHQFFPEDDGSSPEPVVVGRPMEEPQAAKKSRRGPRSRSSQFRGVTFYRRTGRWESHIWDCGKQVYLGTYEVVERFGFAY
ncbi:hypothetical protein Cni_G22330 [Canna indica]|uniref:AP2/ERF domain-containing protein n=1 Tax=Canna indica TaxID=4628 RepID=A0AAQ3QMJ0_9LILI|nr:hypothetical protein Cni_G22330 [Canna indica]